MVGGGGLLKMMITLNLTRHRRIATIFVVGSLVGLGFSAPLASAGAGINADADVEITTSCNGGQNFCTFDASASHSGSALVAGELEVEGPGLPDGSLQAACEGTTGCSTSLDGKAGLGCYTATAQTETAAGGAAQDQATAGVDCGGDVADLDIIGDTPKVLA